MRLRLNFFGIQHNRFDSVLRVIEVVLIPVFAGMGIVLAYQLHWGALGVVGLALAAVGVDLRWDYLRDKKAFLASQKDAEPPN